MKIGVFDSGIGGKKVAQDLKTHFPTSQIISASDREHLPYGSRPPREIISLTNTAIQPLLSANCDVIIIACNTATTVALPLIRKRYPNKKFIGIEPMIKQVGTHTKSKVACVCATPATLASDRYIELKQLYGQNLVFLEPDCSKWAHMIETDSINQQQIIDTIESALAQSADTIVLGCTHYHWIKELIESIAADRAIVLEPTNAIAKQIKNIMSI